MNPLNFKEDQQINFIDKHSVPRKGTIQRIKINNQRDAAPRYFITVKSLDGVVEVIQNLSRIVNNNHAPSKI